MSIPQGPASSFTGVSENCSFWCRPVSPRRLGLEANISRHRLRHHRIHPQATRDDGDTRGGRGADPARLLGRGRFVRNPIWDALHGLPWSASHTDIDVVYFDAADLDPELDRQIETRLAGLFPTVPWSVKNQARMSCEIS